MMPEALFSDLQPTLAWQDTKLEHDAVVAAGVLKRGDKVQLILNEQEQHQLLAVWSDVSHTQSLQVYQNKKALKTWGHAVGVVLNGRGLLANITIQENIMLPFLYHSQQQRSEQAHHQLEKVASTLGLKHILAEQAGLRSPLIHGLVSLCRCVLQQASFLVMQQPCSNMTMQEAEQFRLVAERVVTSLGAGLLYMTDTMEDDGGFQFVQRLGFQGLDLAVSSHHEVAT